MNGVILRQNFLRRNHNLIVSLYPHTQRIYGPYLGKDGRYRVVLYDGNKRRTRQYSKIKMEIKLERLINEPETVDHDNGNKRDDRYENLVLRNRSDHAKLDAIRRKPKKVKCAWCDTKFIISRHQTSKRSNNSAGPFCSRSCSSSYNANKKNTGPILRKKYKAEYFYLKK